MALNDAAHRPLEDRVDALELRVVVLQAFVGTLLRAVEQLGVEVVMGGDDTEDTEEGHRDN